MENAIGNGDMDRVVEVMLELKDLELRAEVLREEIRGRVGHEHAAKLLASIHPHPADVMVRHYSAPTRPPTGAGVSMRPVHGAAPARAQAPQARPPVPPEPSMSKQVVALAAADPSRPWTYHALKEAIGKPFDRAILYNLVSAGRLRRGPVAGEFFGVRGAK